MRPGRIEAGYFPSFRREMPPDQIVAGWSGNQSLNGHVPFNPSVPPTLIGGKAAGCTHANELFSNSTSVLLVVGRCNGRVFGVKEIIVPRLALPGAGLPKMERIVARQLFRFRCQTGSRESLRGRFQPVRQTIRELVNGCNAVSGAQRVLIKRCLGLEDGSRYGSVWMTLDHLQIVCFGIPS